MTPAAENKLVVTSQPSSAITAGGTVSVGVTIQDAFGNAITTGNTGSTDTLAVALSSGSFAAGTTSVAAVNGVEVSPERVPVGVPQCLADGPSGVVDELRPGNRAGRDRRGEGLGDLR